MTGFPESNRYRGAMLFGVFMALQPIQASAADVSPKPSGPQISSGQSTVLAPVLMDASGTRIGAVTISSGSIFNLDNPEDHRNGQS